MNPWAARPVRWYRLTRRRCSCSSPGRAKYWVEVGERAAPHHEAVYRLREALLTASEGEASPALEAALLQEVAARPGSSGSAAIRVQIRTTKSMEASSSCARL